VVVFLGLTGTKFTPFLPLLDAYTTLLVSFFIDKVGLEILMNTLYEFADTAPDLTILKKIHTS
jgi:divalent metal cation (Fe/Co/Zn/Cd) transporter